MLLRVLYPACPHVTHALWQDLGYAQALGDLLDAPWPQVDEAALVQDEIELVLQVNGKLRGAIKVAGGCRPRGDRGGGPGQRRVRYASREGRPSSASSWCPDGWSTSSSDDRRARSRRRDAVRVLVAPAALLLAACGFELRRPPEMQFQSVQLDGLRAPVPAGRSSCAGASTPASPRAWSTAPPGPGRPGGPGGRARTQRRRLHGRRPGARDAVARAAELSPAHARGTRADRADRDRCSARPELQRKHRAGQAVRGSGRSSRRCRATSSRR